MTSEVKNPWQTALNYLEAARSQDWSNTSRAQAAWDGIKKVETNLCKPAATIQELADKLRYLVAVSLTRAEQKLPVARLPWKRRMLISAIADLDRIDDGFQNVRLVKLGKETKRYKELMRSVRSLEELQSELQKCQFSLTEVQAERDAARSALARLNVGVDLSDAI